MMADLRCPGSAVYTGVRDGVFVALRLVVHNGIQRLPLAVNSALYRLEA